MAKWFFRILKAMLTTLVLCALSIYAFMWWAKPNPNDIALVPMALDSQQSKGAGLLTNATKTPWLAYVVVTNYTTTEKLVNKIWVTTDSLQAVSYNTPSMGPDDNVEVKIFYARRLDPPKSTAQHDELPLSAPSPPQ